MTNNQLARITKLNIGYGRLEGTLKMIVKCIDAGLIRDLTTVKELIESRLRKEKKEGLDSDNN